MHVYRKITRTHECVVCTVKVMLSWRALADASGSHSFDALVARYTERMALASRKLLRVGYSLEQIFDAMRDEWALRV